MKAALSLAGVLALPLLANACVGEHEYKNFVRRQHHARQAAAAVAVPAGYASVNPTAIPTSLIVSNPVPQPTKTVATPAAGSTPSGISNAPALPNLASWSNTGYPTPDQVPPTDSPQVQQWIQDVANSGVTIPNLSLVNPGGCPNNTNIVNDQSRCWWSCGNCVRDTDISTCPTKYTWGLTYDDGPSAYTPDLLDYLGQQSLKATFFSIGSRAFYQPAVLQTTYLEGHEIGVHTWSHPALTTLTNEQIIAELGWTKKLHKDLLGVTPKTMRPPYGDIDDRVRAICKAMDLVPVMWTSIGAYNDFDTEDWNVPGGAVTVSDVLEKWADIVGNATTIDTGFIVLEHDLYQQTVEIATGYILPDALARKPALTIQPVQTCLGGSAADAYVETGKNTTSAAGSSGSSGSASPSSATKGSTGGSSSGSKSSNTTSTTGEKAAAGTSGALASAQVGSAVFAVFALGALAMAL